VEPTIINATTTITVTIVNIIIVIITSVVILARLQRHLTRLCLKARLARGVL